MRGHQPPARGAAHDAGCSANENGSGQLAAVCMVLVILLGSGCARRVSMTPAVFLAPAEVDFGEKLDDSPVTLRFRVVNGTAHQVRITGWELSCGCSSLELSREVLAPCAEALATLTIDLRHQFGRRDFRVFVRTDDPEFPELLFHATGIALTKRIEHLVFDLGWFWPGARVDQSIRFWSGKSGTARLVDVRCQPEGLLVARPQSRKPDPEGFFRIRLQGTAPTQEGEFDRTVRLKALGAAWEEAALTVRGRVMVPWRIPEEIFLGLVPNGGQKRLDVAIRPAAGLEEDGMPRAVLSVRSLSSSVQVSVSEDGQGGWVLHIVGLHNGRSRQLRATLELKIEQRDTFHYERRIPVYAILE